MAIKVKSNTTFNLNDDIANFFSLPVDVPIENNDNSDDLKNRVYALDLDTEEKANIINLINKYSTTSNNKEKNKLKKEIDSLLEEYE